MPPCLLCCRCVRRMSVLCCLPVPYRGWGGHTLLIYCCSVTIARRSERGEMGPYSRILVLVSRSRRRANLRSFFFAVHTRRHVIYDTYGMCWLGTLWRSPYNVSRHTILTAAVEGSFAAARCAGLAKKASGRRSVGSPPRARAITEALQRVCASRPLGGNMSNHHQSITFDVL